ncbi:MAG: rhomboid family intramembrane serine protease [Vicinamibacteria bacterium]|nr:rhomboid family intramembrane serine protease [Vicinamibacteria bacterium]
MLLPIGDAPNPKGTPWVTWALILANVLVYVLVSVPLGARRADVRDPALREYVEVVVGLSGGEVSPRQVALQTSAYDLFTFEHGYRPSAPQLADLVTCMFLHGGFMHLVGNMLFLWIYGDNVERRLGAIPYLLAYLATGAMGTLSHALVFSDSPVPLVGASGAISGLLGLYFVWFPRNSVRMLMLFPPFVMQVIEVPARFVLGAYVVFDNLLPFLAAGHGGVAHGAHLGGFVGGAALAWWLNRGVSAPREVGVEADAAGLAPREALARGLYAEAARAWFALPAAEARFALSPGEAALLASWLRTHAHPDAALTLLRRVTRDQPRGEGLAEAFATIGLILLDDRAEPTAAWQYLLQALEAGPRPETAFAVRQALARVEALQKRAIGRLRRPHDW